MWADVRKHRCFCIPPPPPRVVSPLCLLLTVRWEGAEGRGGHGLAAQPDVVRLPGQVGVSVLRWAGLRPAETWCLAVLPGASCEATQPGLWIITVHVEGLHPARYYTGCSTRPSCTLMACDSPSAAHLTHAGPVHFYVLFFLQHCSASETCPGTDLAGTSRTAFPPASCSSLAVCVCCDKS